MRVSIERTRTLYKPYEWSVMSSAYGMIWGRSWTRKGAQRNARQEWGAFLVGCGV